MKRDPVVIERTWTASPEELWALWTTPEGFASWWGPQGFRVDVHTFEGVEGGRIFYDMVADAPEVVEAMKAMGEPLSHETRGWFEALRPYTSLRLMHTMDFLPGVEPYDSIIDVELIPRGAQTTMRVTLHPLHSAELSGMQLEGFTSQLTKLDERFGG